MPRLSFTRDEFQVFENQSLMLEIVRGGDLSASGSCSAYTLQLSSPNAALGESLVDLCSVYPAYNPYIYIHYCTISEAYVRIVGRTKIDPLNLYP